MSELVYKEKVPTTAKKHVSQKYQLRDMTWLNELRLYFQIRILFAWVVWIH